jgi:antitoxin (DNA-binding transcriptional repressor) of toxin-antitoxin stability system
MIEVDPKRADLDTCVDDAQRERIVLTRNGTPVALIVGVEGMDEEQLQLGSSVKFCNLISARRQQVKTTRVELERRIRSKSRR